MTIDGADLTDEQILNGWGDIGPVVVQMRRRIVALDNERARNITALVEQGVEFERRIAKLEAWEGSLMDRHFDARCDALSQRLDTLEHAVKANDEKRHFGEGELRGYNRELERHVVALEARLPAAIPVVTPLAPRCPCEDGSLCALVPGSKAHPHPTCAACGGTVEPERHDYAHPTCYRCLPPPEPLPVRAAAPHSLALPDYLLAPAPAPDYRISEPDDPCYECGVRHGPDENTQCPLSSVYAGPSFEDPCSCEESEALRADLQTTLDDLNRKIGLLGEARSELDRLRAEAQGERDKTARAHKALREREAAELAALQELDEQTELLSQAEADAKEDGQSVLALALALADATERASAATRELSRVHRLLTDERVEARRLLARCLRELESLGCGLPELLEEVHDRID